MKRLIAVVILALAFTGALAQTTIAPVAGGIYNSSGTLIGALNRSTGKEDLFASTTQTLTNKTLDTAVAKGTWTASGTWTLPALTLGGTVSGGGNQVNNVIIGTSTPLAGAFTTATANSFIPNAATVPTNGLFLSAANTLGFATNSTERWVINASGALNCATDGGCDIGNGSADPRDLSLKRNLVLRTFASPAAADACTAGTIQIDTGYIYVCTATGVWKRAALTGAY